MQKFFFYDDYSEGAHPKILEALKQATWQQDRTYGTDSFSVTAEQLIRQHVGMETAAVHFVSSGTHANLVCAAAMLKPYQSIIAAVTGHAASHEAGAIEATGHKMHLLPTTTGKLEPAAIEPVVLAHTDEQMVQPQLVYISQLTELGTCYTKAELEALAALCKQHELYLYIDGARLGNALMSDIADCTLADIAHLCDVFYIGGTKNGGLFGEAIVITNPKINDHWRYHLRQRGALLAKSRSVAEQFVTFFTDGLYFANAKHANTMAEKLVNGLKQLGFTFFVETAGNLVFPILPDMVLSELEKLYGFYRWQKSTTTLNSSVIRLVTSWATPENKVDEFLMDLQHICTEQK